MPALQQLVRRGAGYSQYCKYIANIEWRRLGKHACCNDEYYFTVVSYSSTVAKVSHEYNCA